MSKRSAPLVDRFWSKVDKSGECWEWTAYKSRKGYGSIGDSAPNAGKMLYAHRVSYEIANGPIPEGLVDHKCHNRGCVNPNHLQAVTNKQNHENRAGAAGSTGIRGVYWQKATRKFEVRVGHHGKLLYAGIYTTRAEAEAAAVAMRNEVHTNNLLDRRTQA